MTVGSFFSQYGLFVAEFLTVLLLIVAVIAIAAIAARRGAQPTHGLQVQKVNKQIENVEQTVKRVILEKGDLKKEKRAKKKRDKSAKASGDDKPPRDRIFVLDFKGDVRASATASLRREITAILAVARESDSVLVRLENAGGMVHEHGLAASQLLRLKARKVGLTVAVDKVAASGGYLMACVADRIIAAPFAVVGSIGVLVQLPNFHRLLEEKGVDFEQVMAGRYKRTLTMFGENTDESRDKVRSELDEVHELFKAEISAHRPAVDLELVATGEHWYGTKALELKLIDEVRTSDDYLLEAVERCDVYHVSYKRHKTLPERVMGSVESLLMR